MHSSRMRTARFLPYGGSLSRASVQGGLCHGGGLCPGGWGGVSVMKTPSPLWTVDRQTPVKISPCPKLRLWAVKKHWQVVLIASLFLLCEQWSRFLTQTETKCTFKTGTTGNFAVTGKRLEKAKIFLTVTL